MLNYSALIMSSLLGNNTVQLHHQASRSGEMAGHLISPSPGVGVNSLASPFLVHITGLRQPGSRGPPAERGRLFLPCDLSVCETKSTR